MVVSEVCRTRILYKTLRKKSDMLLTDTAASATHSGACLDPAAALVQATGAGGARGAGLTRSPAGIEIPIPGATSRDEFDRNLSIFAYIGDSDLDTHGFCIAVQARFRPGLVNLFRRQVELPDLLGGG